MSVSDETRSFFSNLKDQYRVRTGGLVRPYSQTSVDDLEDYIKGIEDDVSAIGDVKAAYESSLAAVGGDKNSSDPLFRKANRDVLKYIDLMEDKMLIMSRLSGLSRQNGLLTQERRVDFEDYLDYREHYDNGVGPYVKTNNSAEVKSYIDALMADEFMPQLDERIGSMSQNEIERELQWQLPRLSELSSGAAGIRDKVEQSLPLNSSNFQQDLKAMNNGQSAYEYSIKLVKSLLKINDNNIGVSTGVLASLKGYIEHRNNEYADFKLANKSNGTGLNVPDETMMGSFFDRFNSRGTAIIAMFKSQQDTLKDTNLSHGESSGQVGVAEIKDSGLSNFKSFYASEGYAIAGDTSQPQLGSEDADYAIKKEHGMRL